MDVFAVRHRRPRRWDVALVIAAGGALGGGARFLLNAAMPHEAGAFPLATLLENILGAFLLGALIVILLDVRPPSRYARPFLGVGLLGGFTTFSAYTADIREMLMSGNGPAAIGYATATMLLGLTAAWLGLNATRALVGVTRTGRPRRST